MTLREKLDLLWKYLLLAVIVYAVAQVGYCHRSAMLGCGSQGGHDMMWVDDDGEFEDMDIDVDIDSFGDGDSSIQVIINGETIDLKDMKKMGKNVIVKMIHDSDEYEQYGKNIKIIKKKMTDE